MRRAAASRSQCCGDVGAANAATQGVGRCLRSWIFRVWAAPGGPEINQKNKQLTPWDQLVIFLIDLRAARGRQAPENPGA